LQYVNNAKELWDELADRYDQTNGAKLFQLQQEINDLAQGNLDITRYYTRLRRLWEKLSTLDANTQCTCMCNCGGKIKMHKAEQDRRLIQFLMGLNEVYTVMRGSILMMNPLPTMPQAFSILVQEEKQREVKPSTRMSLASTSLNASTSLGVVSGSNSFKTNYSQNKHTNGNNAYRGHTNHFQNYNSNNTYPISDVNKANLFCDYCKKTGHIEAKCYRKHGFPPNFKFTNGRNSGSAALAHSNCEMQTDPSQGTQGLTQYQYDHLVKLLENTQIQGTAGSTKDSVGNIMDGAVNFAGIMVCHSSINEIGNLSCSCSKLSAESWIIDSGASNHMTFNKTLLTNIRPLPYPFLITLSNGYRVKVTEIGDAHLNSTLTLFSIVYTHF